MPNRQLPSTGHVISREGAVTSGLAAPGRKISLPAGESRQDRQAATSLVESILPSGASEPKGGPSMTDLRFAWRQLLKSPGFTLLAVLTLAAGIGLNTAIFSLINDLFLPGLPFQEPTRVLHVFSHFREQTVDFPLSAP